MMYYIDYLKDLNELVEAKPETSLGLLDLLAREGIPSSELHAMSQEELIGHVHAKTIQDVYEQAMNLSENHPFYLHGSQLREIDPLGEDWVVMKDFELLVVGRYISYNDPRSRETPVVEDGNLVLITASGHHIAIRFTDEVETDPS